MIKVSIIFSVCCIVAATNLLTFVVTRSSNPTPFVFGLLPSQTDIQLELVRRGYTIEVDGVVGKATRLAWDDAVIKQYATGVFELDPNKI